MSRSVRVVALAVVVAVLIPAVGRAGDDTADLRLHFEQGKTYTLVVTVEQKIRQLVQADGTPGEEQVIAQTVTVGQTLDVEKVDKDGVATVKVTFSSLAMRTEMGEFSIEHDSADPPDEVLPAARPLAVMAGRSFVMKVKPDGTLVALEGVNEMLEAALKSIALPEASRERLRESLEQQFGRQALRELIEGHLSHIPGKPAGIGDTWSHTLDVESGYAATFEAQYTLREREHGVATIGTRIKLTPNAAAPLQKLGGAMVRYELEGTQEGSFRIDEASGWYIDGALTQRLKGDMLVTDPRKTKTLRIPMIIESTITLATE
ncbi:MAG: hypothetical protein JW889_07900 [Verrucomicrobia bacterium]|nr:hypothetical protein [Verrucomicrobiota bacterium]